MSTGDARVYAFGPFRLDTGQRLLLRDGTVVPVAAKVFETLQLLVEAGGRVLSKEELIESLWPDTFVEEGNLAKNVSRLRKLLGKSASGEYIATIPKRGYRFVANVTAIGPAASGRLSRQTPITSGAGDGASRTGAPVELRRLEAIAVLPFRAFGPAADEGYLSVGLADALITQLGATGRIAVRPTSAVLPFAAGRASAAEAAERLQVDAVLEGTVQRNDDRVRVTAQLVGGRDAAPLWAGKFDAVFTNIFELQDSIAERVAGALAIELTGEERARATRRYTANPEAYELYMKGRFLWNLVRPLRLPIAIDYLAQACRLDPHFALAHAWLADCYSRLPIASDVPSREAFPKAKEQILKALSLDARVADTHNVLGWINFWHDWDWEASERAHQRALALDPQNADAHFGYAHLLSNIGRHDEAIREIDTAIALDPLSLIMRALRGLFLFQARRFEAAVEQLRPGVELEPDFWVARHIMGMNYERLGRFEEALSELKAAAATAEGSTKPQSVIGYVLARTGWTADARRVLNELRGRAASAYVPPYNMALVHHGLGETSEAIALLERAYDERDVHMVFLGTDPKWDDLRGTAAFDALVARMGFGG